MGVPAFFRWLSRKYPSVVVHCVEEKPESFPEGFIDSSKPNPNGIEFDNLYLDMNGIIHPCTHPEDKPAPKDEDEMMIAIFKCIDRLFSIVRPRKLLYMAIDGVAPRAKMNQQRSRRFRASKENIEKIEEMARLREELLNKGAYLPSEKAKEDHFDSNCITPGTPFMSRLSVCLNYYIHERLNNDPGWKGIKVILSDANVPGEGEHKIMDFIRKQRAQPDHDPNTNHVLCGADADLIMLGLATHEPNFTIIREEFRPNKPKPCDLCHQLGHEMKDCVGCPKPADGQIIETPNFSEEIPFIFVRLNVLREYLERELIMPQLPFRYDFERAVDDWVFMCFFVGNDFLPHLPSLEIREGAIDRLVNLYKNCLYKTGGFITDSGSVNLNRVQYILYELGKVEDQIFKKRRQNDILFKQRKKQKKNMTGKPSFILGGEFAPTPLGLSTYPRPIHDPRNTINQARIESFNNKATLEALIRPESKNEQKESPNDDDSSDEEANDEVRLWEDGFKDRYYESKFDISKENSSFRTKVAHEYVRGLCWVLRYYYQGCASWKWFFPYHYAPFASDFINIEVLSTDFEKDTQPFNPLEQLMGVFPAASSSHVPKPWATLMYDPFSPIIDFYPSDFKIDLNGKKFAWQGVALLPFVDEKRLFKALEPYYDKLTPEEKRRNTRGDDKIYIGMNNNGYNFIRGLYDFSKPFTEEEFDFCVDGMLGKILLWKDCVGMNGILPSPIQNLPKICENVVISARFRNPTYPSNFIFKAKRLKGVREPYRVLKPENLNSEQSRNFFPQIGMVPSMQRASLSDAGRRMFNYHNQSIQNYNHHLRGGNTQLRGPGMYSQVPPPPSMMPLFPQRNYPSRSYNRSYGYTTSGTSRIQSDFHANSNNPRGRKDYQHGKRYLNPMHSHGFRRNNEYDSTRRN